MSTYHKYLSTFLIFFSILFVIFLCFIESNTGFKWIFNLTNRFFLGFKVEEISGNWRDFTLKNVSYNNFNTSIKSNQIHVMLDIKSLFKSSTIVKDIKVKNLIIFLKKNQNDNFFKKENINNFFKKNNSIQYLITLKNVHIDKIFFKTSNLDVFLSNVLTGVELLNKNITIFPTYIDDIKISLSKNINPKKMFKKNYLVNLKQFFNIKQIHHFLSFSSIKKEHFFPLNINLIFLHCKKINFFNFNNTDFFEIKLKAKLKNNVLNIKNIAKYSTFLKIQSYGKIVFYNNYVFSCIIHNKMLVPKLHNRVFSVLLKAHLDKKIKFSLQYNDLYKMNVIGTIFLDNLNNSFYLNLKSKYLFFSLRKDYILKLKNFNLVLKGNINDYSLCIKNIFKIKNMPSIFVKIKIEGNLKSILLKSIKFSPAKKATLKKENNNLINNIISNQYILQLAGKTNVKSVFNNNINNIEFSRINLNGNLLKKKISILGSLNYRNFNFLDIPGIELFLGQNKLRIVGSLGKKFNVHSSIHANNLDYFFSNLKGEIKSESSVYGNDMLPIIMTSQTFGKNITIDDIYLKSFKILTNLKIKDRFLGKILLDIKKMHFSNFYINSLCFKSNWNNKKQNFFLFFKSNILSLQLIVHSSYDNKTGNWYGSFKKINIQTCLGKIVTKNNPLFFCYNLNSEKYKNFKKYLQKKNIFSSFLLKTQTSLSNIFNKYFINFNTQVSIDTKLKWIFGKNITNVKMNLMAKNIKFKKIIKEKVFFEELDYIDLLFNFKKNNFTSKWILKKSINSTEKKNISGYFNIIDIYNKKNIKGKFFISDFPISFINFFTTSFKKSKGSFTSNIVLFGTLYTPRVSSNIFLQDVVIKSDNILQYISFIFPYFSKKIEKLKIDQSIIMTKANILFTLNTEFQKSNNIEWNLLFKSEEISVSVFPKINIKFSSHLNLHYLFSKYDLIGYVKFALFYFKINEKNFSI